MGLWESYKSFFRNNPNRDALIYLMLITLFAIYSCVVIAEAFIDLPCDRVPEKRDYPNVKYIDHPCATIPRLELLGLTQRQCDFGRRIIISILLGAAIGYERRSPDRPAGLRTMSVTAMGACLFTLSSIYGFDGWSSWDASRVTAAIPSGVGFLGAGVIWKGTVEAANGEKHHHVNGLTTAASIWLSAAVGAASGGKLYFVAAYTVVCVVLILRFGPRGAAEQHADEHEDNKAEKSPAAEDVEAAPPTSNERAPLVNPVSSASVLSKRKSSAVAGSLAAHL